jgi:cell division protein FtsN
MTQDFAKIRPEPLLERKPAEVPPAWSLMVTGIVVGITVGVFGCFLLYLSGNVPPLNRNGQPASNFADNGQEPPAESPVTADTEEELQLEFYTELKEYEVTVDAIPVEVAVEDPNQALDYDVLLQTGAFQQRGLAALEMQRQQALGVDVEIKQQELPGQLYYLQSGPYTTQGQLSEMLQLLRSNNIQSLPLRPQ